MKVSRILATKVGGLYTVVPQDSVATAVARLAQHNIGALLVINEQSKLVGILSERDIVRRAAENPQVLADVVADVMTKDVVVGVPQDDIMAVANTMTERRFRHLPIVDDEKIVGMISIGDVIKVQRDQFRGEIDTLETQIMDDNAN